MSKHLRQQSSLCIVGIAGSGEEGVVLLVGETGGGGGVGDLGQRDGVAEFSRTGTSKYRETEETRRKNKKLEL
jgi:hypothetical protein